LWQIGRGDCRNSADETACLCMMYTVGIKTIIN